MGSVLSRMYLTGRKYVDMYDMIMFIVVSSVSLLRFVFLVVGLSGCPCSRFRRDPQVPLGLRVRSGGGLWLSGDIRGTSPDFFRGYGS